MLGQVAFVEAERESCPGALQVEARVREILGMKPDATLEERATLKKEGETLRIVVRRPDGSVLGERTLSAAASCDELEKPGATTSTASAAPASESPISAPPSAPPAPPEQSRPTQRWRWELNAAGQLLRAELHAERNCQKALPDFDAVLAASAPAPLAERALYGRATCRLRLGDSPCARTDLQRYLARFPKGSFADQVRARVESGSFP